VSTQLNDVWMDMFNSIPSTPTDPQKNNIPIAEILRTIFFCLQDGIEDNRTALSLLDKIAFLRNDDAFLNWKAMVEYDAKSYIRSFETSELLLNRNHSGESYFNVGRAAYKANQLEKSEKYLRNAIELLPGEISPILDYAVTVCTMGEFDKAFDIINNIDLAMCDEKSTQIVEFNKGWHFIRRGDFKKGIDRLHIGRLINVWGSHAGKYKKPLWDGNTHHGKTILMVGEGGIGDEIINARFAKTIYDRGMHPIMSTVHRNQSMLSSVPFLENIVDNKEIDLIDWDYWVPVMDLPFTLKINNDEIPSQKYLSANPEYVEKWKNIIKSDKKLNIGIRWMGNPRYELELARTIPLQYFQYLTDMDVQLFSLQKDDEKTGLCLPNTIIDISDKLESWDDTMGAMENLDLIITSCTSVAHVAGALGRPTWVVIPLLPYYTWADMKKDSYWYDTVQLYRQKEWKNWREPFQQLKNDLKKKLSDEQ
jgi:tetratricopeptide (TPR) repeat protein